MTLPEEVSDAGERAKPWVAPRVPIQARPGERSTGTVRVGRCPRCRGTVEVRVPAVPVEVLNRERERAEAVEDYVRATAGGESVLIPVATLNELGRRSEVAREAAAGFAVELREVRRLLPPDVGEGIDSVLATYPDF